MQYRYDLSRNVKEYPITIEDHLPDLYTEMLIFRSDRMAKREEFQIRADRITHPEIPCSRLLRSPIFTTPFERTVEIFECFARELYSIPGHS